MTQPPRPVIATFDDGTCAIYPAALELTHAECGLLIADMVRHTAKAFGVTEDAVWAWVMQERRHPTTRITGQRIS
jgi:hypothetical protein